LRSRVEEGELKVEEMETNQGLFWMKGKEIVWYGADLQDVFFEFSNKIQIWSEILYCQINS